MNNLRALADEKQGSPGEKTYLRYHQGLRLWGGKKAILLHDH
jgi:hypothetical protein